MKIHIASRTGACPLVDQIENRIEARLRPVEEFVAAERASQKTSAGWRKALAPAFWAILGAIFTFLGLLAVNHAAIFSKQ